MIETDFEVNNNVKTVNFEGTWTTYQQNKVLTNNDGQNFLTKVEKSRTKRFL